MDSYDKNGRRDSVILLPPPGDYQVTADKPIRKANGRTHRISIARLAKCAAASFSLLIYIAVFASGMINLIDRGIDSVFIGEVFPEASSVALFGKRNALPESKPGDPLSPADDPGSTDTHTLKIKKVDHSASSVHDIYNETQYSPNEDAILADEHAYPSAEYTAAMYGVGAPLVLVIHTHGTEAFTKEGTTECPVNEAFRSSDTNENVVAVGDAFCETLERCGIGTIHCPEMFDLPTIMEAYDNSAAAVRAYLAEYPSIAYVFDIHRDALLSESGEYLAPTFAYGGKSTAEVMLVVGTDAAGAFHPDWDENLALALGMQSVMIERYGGMARGYNLRTASFNQQLSPGFLLAEVGSCANTLAEAKRAAALLALTFYETVEKSSPPISPSEAIAGY